MKEQLKSAMQQILVQPQVTKALACLKMWEKQTFETQLELCAIRSPSNDEKQRARRYYDLMCQVGLDHVHMDEVNNVIGLLKGSGNGPTLVIAAHTDTVFGPDVDCTPVLKADGLIWAPGICDDTRGMAEVLAIAKAMCTAGLRATGDILFVGDVGEESLGDLRGTKHLFATYEHIDAFVSIDASKVENLVHNAIAGYKYRFTYTGRGGHALTAFGIPNVNNAIGYAAAQIAAIEVPEMPRTIFNIGVIQGGVSVNAIPSEATMMVDIRSMGSDELETVNKKVLAAVQNARDTENLRWNHPTERIALKIELLSSRPGGIQPPDSPIVLAAMAAYELFGIQPVLTQGNSTDSNIPISLGIPAVTLGRGGKQYDGHTVNERFDPTGAYVGPQRDLLLLLALAGLDGICSPVIKPHIQRHVD